MKPDIHPNYRFVVFRDISADFEFLTKSTIDDRMVKETVEIDGAEYPLVIMDVSSASHPFYTGTQKIMDTEGRVERYYRKYGFANTEGIGVDEDDVAADEDEAAADDAAPEATAETATEE